MRLPEDLSEAVEAALVSCNSKVLKEASEALSADYRSGQGSSRGFQTKTQFLAYLATRLPATFGACAAVFQALRDRCPHFSCHSILDLGSGPGTAVWAALDVFPEIGLLHLVERESVAIEVGKMLSEKAIASAWKSALWRQVGLDAAFDIPVVDMAVFSYVYGELKKDVGHAVIERLWETKIPVVAVIEPGTPKGFERIRELRAFVLEKGARIIAPCPHGRPCPMLNNDWCHFSARIERTRLHRQLKEGSLGYEDEKYSYVVYAHPSFDFSCAPIQGRILRHPQKGSGFVRMSVCEADGVIREGVITRSNKAKYRIARDAEWGDVWE
ncbi:MAG TPA: small ribosomal subunit Rsm22 family protein [Chlamydiales bacterium]|jgi:ribosomal protein RSM22 (predicted rRNA methylase)|nr:small ribosomal subunit Rsm22 family protein [Chlamydiales bacterium]